MENQLKTFEASFLKISTCTKACCSSTAHSFGIHWAISITCDLIPGSAGHTLLSSLSTSSKLLVVHK